MKKILLVFVVLCCLPYKDLFACEFKLSSVEATTMPFFHRGINLYGWWEASRNPMLEENDLNLVKRLGFDFVRLPVDPKWLNVEDKEKSEEILDKLRCDIVDLLKRDLTVIIDLHPGSESEKIIKTMAPNELRAYLEKTWIKAKYAIEGLPTSRIAIQLLNEPDPALKSFWWQVQGELIQNLRFIYPHHLFIASSIQNGPWNYVMVKPYNDNNVIYDFHYYQPTFFTHHAAEWNKNYDHSEKNDGIAYPSVHSMPTSDPSNKMKKYIALGWNKTLLEAKMASGLTWASLTGAKLICLEFGVYRPYVPAKSRANWLRDMREILDANKIPWAVWEYNGGFGLVDRYGNVDYAAAEALGLNVKE